MPPVVLALLACDRVARTIRAGRADLLGVFHAVSLPLPAYLSFAVYYALTDVHRPTDVTLAFLGPADERLGEGVVTLPGFDPLAVIEGIGSFDVRVSRAGTHRLRIEHAGALLAEQPILIGEG